MRVFTSLPARLLSIASVFCMILTSLSLMVNAVGAEKVEVSLDLPPLFTPRAASGVAMGDDDRTIYVFGGYQYNFTIHDTTQSTVFIYDVELGTTTSGTSMSHGVAWPSVAKLTDGRIAVIGGHDSSVNNGTKWVQIYDPDADSWTINSSAPLNISRAGTALGADGKVYVFGPANHQNCTMIYDPAADSWSFGTNLSSGRARYGSVAVTYNESAIFVIGGMYLFYVQIMPGFWIPVIGDTNYVDIYNPQTHTWTVGQSLNHYKLAGGAFLTGDGTMYYFGGYGWLGNAYDEIERYDPSDPNATWELSNYTISRTKSNFGTAVDSYGRAFLVGGLDYPNATILDDVEMLLVTEVSEVNEISLTYPVDGSPVSGIVDIQVELKNQMMASPSVIDMYVDGSQLESQLGGTATSWTFRWNASGLDDGSDHTLLVRAFFTDGTISEDSVTCYIGAASEDDDLDDRLSWMEANISAILNELANVTTRLDSIDSDISDIQLDLVSLLAEIVLIGDSIENLSSATDELSANMTYLSSELESVLDIIALLQADIDTLQSSLDDLDSATTAELSQLSSQVDLLNADIESLLGWADEVTAALELLAEQPEIDLSEILVLIGALQDAIDGLNDSELTEQIEDLQDSVEELDSALDESSSASEDAENAAIDAKNLSMIAIALVVVAIIVVIVTWIVERRQKPE